MKILYDGEVVGGIVGDSNLMLDEALKLAGIDVDEMDGGDPRWDYDLFETCPDEDAPGEGQKRCAINIVDVESAQRINTIVGNVDKSDLIKSAQAVVSDAGYRVVGDEDGGCNEVTRYDYLIEIGVTVEREDD